MEPAESNTLEARRESDPRLDPHVLSHVFRARRHRLTWAAAGGAVLAFLLSFLIRTTYRATVVVLPPERSSGALSMLSGAGSTGASMASTGALAALGMKSSTDLYVALLGSESVEDAVMRQFDLQRLYKKKYWSESRKELEANTRITADTKSGLITVAVVDREPTRAADMANAYVTLYDKTSARLAITDAQRRRLFLEQQVGKTKDDLAQSEDELGKTSIKTGMLQPEGDVRALISFEETLRAQIAIKTARLTGLRSSLSPDNPDLRAAEHELAGLQAQVAEVETKQSSGNFLNSRSGQTEASLQYGRQYRKVKFNEALLELLLKNLEIARLDEAQEGSVMQVVDPALVPDMKWAPHRSFFLAGGFFAGLLLALLWSIYKDYPRMAAGARIE